VVPSLIDSGVNGCETLCCDTAIIPSSYPSSDFVVDTVSSYQMILGCKNTGAHTSQKKPNSTEIFDKHSKSRTEFTMETWKDPTVGGESVTYDRYAV